MKKQFAGSMMIGAKLLEQLANAVIDAGGKEEDVRRLEINSGLRKKVAELIVEVKGVKQSADGVVRFLVDYTRPLADLINDCGFDWVNSNIKEKYFPITMHPNGNVEMKLFHFNRTISSDQAIQEMDKEGYRPAELPELLAYAKNNPDEQRKYPIVGLGSVWRGLLGSRSVPSLWDVSGGRGLDLLWYDNSWNDYYRFLAVRKS